MKVSKRVKSEAAYLVRRLLCFPPETSIPLLLGEAPKLYPTSCGVVAIEASGSGDGGGACLLWSLAVAAVCTASEEDGSLPPGNCIAPQQTNSNQAM